MAHPFLPGKLELFAVGAELPMKVAGWEGLAEAWHCCLHFEHQMAWPGRQPRPSLSCSYFLLACPCPAARRFPRCRLVRVASRS